MKNTLRSAIAAFITCLLLFSFFPIAISADGPEEAEDISSTALVESSKGFVNLPRLFDKEFYLWNRVYGPCSLTLKHDEGIGSLYVMFAFTYGEYTVTNLDTGDSVTCGQYGFLNDFLDLVSFFGSAPKRVKLSFDHSNVVIRELYAFSQGEVPSFVQKWKPPVEGNADLVLFSTHGDDEHLFFAGILPYYAVEMGYNVQVVYLTDHHNNAGDVRNLEMLAGLWNVGIENYPVFGPFEDFLFGEKAMVYLGFQGYGWDKNDLLGYVVENVRRFKPIVVVGHDFAGEYGHGQHMVYAELLAEAVEISMDPDQFPDSAQTYGLWDTPKAYFHLLKDNQIIMDWDRPLESFGGKTAFEVSIYQGFASHKTQVPDFSSYYRGYSRAIDLPENNPCYYGLYRSTVGEDVLKNDFFENVYTHAEQKRLKEEAARAEEERLAEEKRKAEEAKRAEEEAARLKAEAEAKAKAEEEAKRLAELEAQQKAQLEKEATEQKNRIILTVASCILGAAILAGILLLIFRKK